MSESVWLRQVEEGLMAEIRKYVKYTNDAGKRVPINRVMVRKPDQDFLDLTGKDKDIKLPCVSITHTMTSFDKKRVDSSSNFPVIVSRHGKSALVEDRAKPYRLFYQLDFWGEYADDIDQMTLSWLANHTRWFNLPVVDSGGTKRDCYATVSGTLTRADSVVGKERLFRATINYCIRVEIDENNRYNVNVAKEIAINTQFADGR